MEIEKDVERLLKKEVEKLGGMCFKLVSPGMRGTPDRLVLLPDGKVHFIETKTLSGRPSIQQMAFKKKIEERNGSVKILSGKEEVMTFIEDCRGALR